MTKMLIRRGSVSLLFAYGINRFSHDMAQICKCQKEICKFMLKTKLQIQTVLNGCVRKRWQYVYDK